MIQGVLLVPFTNFHVISLIEADVASIHTQLQGSAGSFFL